MEESGGSRVSGGRECGGCREEEREGKRGDSFRPELHAKLVEPLLLIVTP